MAGVMEAGMEEQGGSALQRGEASPVGRREVRWSARRKEGVVLRLLRGESLDLLARETGQPAGGSPRGVRSSSPPAGRG